MRGRGLIKKDMKSKDGGSRSEGAWDGDQP